MTYAELTRRLTRLGIEFRRQAKGSHEIWEKPGTGLYTRIAHHAQREIPAGTLARILRDLELTQDDLRNA
jgi:predicted RNA binding protein YcfA (HicA-like mRNA interferase family)